jgi:hypothetical protein
MGAAGRAGVGGMYKIINTNSKSSVSEKNNPKIEQGTPAGALPPEVIHVHAV